MAFVLRRLVIEVPVNSTRTADFQNALVRGLRVLITNRGPGQVSVTRSVSENGVDYTILPGETTINARRVATITLPDYATFTQLGISTTTLPATVVLRWVEILEE